MASKTSFVTLCNNTSGNQREYGAAGINFSPKMRNWYLDNYKKGGRKIEMLGPSGLPPPLCT